MFRDQAGVVVVEQVGIFAGQAQPGGRLRGDDVATLADRLGQHGDVPLGQSPGDVQRAEEISRAPAGSAPAARRRPRRCVPARPPGPGQLRIVVVGVQVDEIGHLMAAASRGRSAVAGPRGGESSATPT